MASCRSRIRAACTSRSRARTADRGVRPEAGSCSTPRLARGACQRFRRVAAEAKAVTPSELRQLSASLGQPIYWAGPAPSVTYEVSQNADGSIYVRYLPEGTAVGDPEEHRTIATYPLADAHDQTKSLADEAGDGVRSSSTAAASRSSPRRPARRTCTSRIPASTTRSRSSIPFRGPRAGSSRRGGSFPSASRAASR